jgi:hypothetical protein
MATPAPDAKENAAPCDAPRLAEVQPVLRSSCARLSASDARSRVTPAVARGLGRGGSV